MRSRKSLRVAAAYFIMLTCSESYTIASGGNKSDTNPPQSSCLQQCVPGSNRTFCETAMCSGPLNISIPTNMYSGHIYCVGGGHGVAGYSVVSTECRLIPIYSTTGLQWEMRISEGTLCKAICYNTATLVSQPDNFNVYVFPVHSKDHSNNPYTLPILLNEWYCSLEDTDIDRDNIQETPVSGNCKLDYIVSLQTHKMVPEVLAATSPPTAADTSCDTVCLRTTDNNKMYYTNVTIFEGSGNITTFEECPVCSLTQWKATLPVPVNEALPLCNLTMIGNNTWHLEKIGGPEVECSAQCFCNYPILGVQNTLHYPNF